MALDYNTLTSFTETTKSTFITASDPSHSLGLEINSNPQFQGMSNGVYYKASLKTASLNDLSAYKTADDTLPMTLITGDAVNNG